ncbi:MAG: hypothetical protein HOV79_17705, partial [Hamadaea sp.]|nr:hypothetical protein [Hamadaea sp.]
HPVPSPFRQPPAPQQPVAPPPVHQPAPQQATAPALHQPPVAPTPPPAPAPQQPAAPAPDFEWPDDEQGANGAPTDSPWAPPAHPNG